MSAPDISVIIPVHNAAATLVEQLDAIEAESGDAPSHEILVVDNRSTDDSARLARDWADRWGVDLKVLDAREKAGEPFARNVGLAAARADRVVYCDADDRVAPTWLRSMARALEDSPYATGPIDMDALNPRWLADVRGTSVTGRSLMYDRVPYAHGCNMGFRRDELVALGGFDENYTAGCDLDIAIRMWQAGHELGYDDGALVHYRLRSSLAETYRQGRFYGRYRVPIRRQLASLGVAAASESGAWKRALWLLRKAPAAILHRPTRARWVWVLAQIVGDRQGSREASRGDRR